MFKNYLGEEDDDDFEKVRVIEVDLALKKIITQVGNKTENTFGEGFTRFQDVNGEREVKTDVRALTRLSDVTDAEYYLNKTPITVAIGDTISYQIRIYNEGSINATASEIKDYIPKGLEFESIYSSDGTELTKSEYDNTICFWRKHKGSSLDEVTYISFTFNNSAKCDFIIKGYSIENYNDNNKTSLNFNVNDLYTKYNDEWQLWCIKIDNEHVFDDTTSYSGKIGITCEVYVNEIVNGEYSIKKYVLNGESTSPFNVESPLFNKNV